MISRIMTAAIDHPPSVPPATEGGVDLTAYCGRIGYDGPLEPTFAVLAALQQLHPAAIPFEAIDVLLGRGVDLAPGAVDAKLIGARRGGYCYEQNGLFKRVLQAIGFRVEGLIARVNWNAPPAAPLRAPSHMALRVTVDGEEFLVDVGFGTCIPTAPLLLADRAPQPTGHETFRFVAMGAETQLQVLIGGEWKPVYRILPGTLLDSDYEPANWFTATHPSSQFRQRLIVTRTAPDARHVLAGARLTIRPPGGAAEQRILDADAIERELAERFLLPVEPDWRPVIERAARDLPDA